MPRINARAIIKKKNSICECGHKNRSHDKKYGCFFCGCEKFALVGVSEQ